MAFTPVALNLPPYPFRLTTKDEQLFIFDELRKKHLVLTPEEWVRQHFIQFLVLEKKFPKSLIQIEGGLVLNQLQKRTDVVVYNRSGERIMIIECKAPSVKLSQAVFDQAARYNSVHQVKWLVITNGLAHCYATIDRERGQFSFLQDLPSFDDL